MRLGTVTTLGRKRQRTSDLATTDYASSIAFSKVIGIARAAKKTLALATRSLSGGIGWAGWLGVSVHLIAIEDAEAAREEPLATIRVRMRSLSCNDARQKRRPLSFFR